MSKLKLSPLRIPYQLRLIHPPSQPHTTTEHHPLKTDPPRLEIEVLFGDRHHRAANRVW